MKVIASLLIVTISLIACSPSEPTALSPVNNNNGVSYISGLYDISYTVDHGTFSLEDIAYFHITDNGLIYIYDYLGDSNQKGMGRESVKDCYYRKQSAHISHTNDNRYEIKEKFKDAEQLEITRMDDGSLSVAYSNDDIKTFPVSSVSLQKLTPICSNSDTLQIASNTAGLTQQIDNSVLRRISNTIWDTSGSYSNGITDEYYLHIGSDGRITDFDFTGDSFDNLENCYRVFQDTKFVHVRDSEYLLNFMDKPVAGFKVTLALDASGNLVITNGGEKETLPRTNLTLSDMQPSCL